jgi:hypothetical protein
MGLRPWVLWLLVLVGGPAVVHGQPMTWQQQAQALVPVDGVSSNSIQTMEADGDSLWVGPLFSVYTEAEARFLTADVPELLEEDNVVFTIDATNNPDASTSTVWAGLAFDTGGGTPGTAGFLFSTDGGDSFTFRLPALDAPEDTTIAYGDSTLPAIPVTANANSTPQGLDAAPPGGTVWMAGGQAGIRYSRDGGQTWQRAVLPPDTLRSVRPNQTPPFLVGPPVSQNRGWLNYVAFSVLVDETGTVWAGTAGGVNRSRPQDVVGDDRAWQRFAADNTPDGLTGNSVVAIAEQPIPGARNAIWMATWALNQTQSDRQRFGITVTRDGGATFEQTLIGEQVTDIAFRDSSALHPALVYAAGESGLLISSDDGATWRTVTDFPLDDDTAFLRSDARVQSVATTRSALWVSTNDGLLRLSREREADLLDDDPSASGPSWQLFRTNVPVNPEEPSETVPDVPTYAYPNPFSPSDDEAVRIRYELPEGGPVTVEIFDFGMNRVRTLTRQQPAGQQEVAWDGSGADGLRLPNGTYFYTVDLGGRTVRGKILLVD